jgi:hypothetical protein
MEAPSPNKVLRGIIPSTPSSSNPSPTIVITPRPFFLESSTNHHTPSLSSVPLLPYVQLQPLPSLLESDAPFSSRPAPSSFASVCLSSPAVGLRAAGINGWPPHNQGRARGYSRLASFCATKVVPEH